jgi:hypothetical protein
MYQLLRARGEKHFIRIHHRIYLCGRGSISTMKSIIVQNSDSFGFLFCDLLQSTEICPPTLIYHHLGRFPIFNCDTYPSTIRHCLLSATGYYPPLIWLSRVDVQPPHSFPAIKRPYHSHRSVFGSTIANERSFYLSPSQPLGSYRTQSFIVNPNHHLHRF